MAFFAALLAVGLIAVATPIGEQVTCKIQSAVAALTGGSYSCDAAQASNPYEVDPSTVVTSSVEQSSSTSAGISVPAGPGSLDVEGGGAEVIADATYLDGSGSRTLSSTWELSGSYEVEKGVKVGDRSEEENGVSDDKAGFEAKVAASGGVALSRTESEVRKCDSPGQPSCSELDSGVEDEIDEVSVSHQVKLLLNAEASIGAGMELKEDVASSENARELEVGASLKIGGEVAYVHTESTSRTDTGEVRNTSHEFMYEGQISVSSSLEVGDPNKSDEAAGEAFGLKFDTERSDSYMGRYRVTYGESGDLQAITFTNVVEGSNSGSGEGVDSEQAGPPTGKGAEVHVTSTVETTLDVSSLSPEQKRIAEDYVNSSLTNGALVVPQSVLNPSRPSSSPFDNLLYEKARVTRTQQKGGRVTNSESDKFLFVHWETVRSTSKEDVLLVEQLGRPSGPGGERQYEEVEVP
ncbi:hypothetical protein [Actinomyces bowdenii]|uniref:Uncharacterized protein n=1 Tax=Actinomyces bowdenii TaxID=131109 RepID=A0A3P1VE31_9ACTO|nr:hypothetical protein [Actinomyces bowdenii]RRD30763.1 hypothetical protein EII10_01205 [Actinomyces bowdenii]